MSAETKAPERVKGWIHRDEFEYARGIITMWEEPYTDYAPKEEWEEVAVVRVREGQVVVDREDVDIVEEFSNHAAFCDFWRGDPCDCEFTKLKVQEACDRLRAALRGA